MDLVERKSPRQRLTEFSRLDFQNQVDIVWRGKDQTWEASIVLDLGNDKTEVVYGGDRPTLSGALIGLEDALRDRQQTVPKAS